MSQRSLPCFDEYAEECGENPVLQKIKAKKFTSRSKGWRNGKQRIRKNEKPIILVKYGDSGYKYWDGGDTNMNANAYEGGDCWGFSPAYRREDCVDIVGLYLQGKYVDWNTVPTIRRKKAGVS
jgi:hypothetical protein